MILDVLIGLMPLGSFSMAAQEPYVRSAGFERMKQLVGSWEGEMDMGEGPREGEGDA